MIFFLDENFPKKAIKLLESYNFKVIDIRGTKNEGLSDNRIFDLAKKNKAIFLTTDKDFFHAIHFKSKPHLGIVIIALSQPNSNKIIEKLNWFLNEIHNYNITNQCFLITDRICKIY